MDIMKYPLYYNGKKQKAHSKTFFKNINPATGKQVQKIESASEEDVDAAVKSAQEGFKIWSKMAPTERGRILKKTAKLMRERNEEIAKIEVEDCGKPITESLTDDVMSAADALEYFGGIAAGIRGDYHDFGGNFAYTRREPLGVCGGIGAWNYPIQIAGWKSAPALACGNSMVFKPSESTPRTALILAELFTEAGLPDGVFNIVQGEGKVGQMITNHPDIRKVSLTGEINTGKKIMADAAKTLKHVTLELGGKSPLIIFDDADINQAVIGAMMANFYTQGEVCSNGTRVYVHESIKEGFTEKLVEKTKELIIGDPTDKRTQVGALINKKHLEKVLYYIDKGKEEDKLIYGGKQWKSSNEQLKNGYFVEPTIFEAKSESSSIMQNEIFGPVLTLTGFEKEDEVIQKANNTPYGLSAGVFTKDLQRAHRVINALEAGSCWINTYNITPVEIPFGPYKQSGFGRENGFAALEAYSQLKTVYVEMDKIDSPY